MLGLDNGKFERIVRSEEEEAKVWKIDKTLTKRSARSLGRDIFVPSAAKISMILLPIERLLLEQKSNDLIGLMT